MTGRNPFISSGIPLNAIFYNLSLLIILALSTFIKFIACSLTLLVNVYSKALVLKSYASIGLGAVSGSGADT
jgi:hypothetical protein